MDEKEEDHVSPLKYKDDENYGSLDLTVGDSDDEEYGGLIQYLPSEGYCLVFTRQQEYGFGGNKSVPYAIEYKNGTLMIDRHEHMSLAEYREDGWEIKLQEALDIPYKITEKKQHEEEQQNGCCNCCSNGGNDNDEDGEKEDAPYDLLKNFKQANISYAIESDRIEKFYYVIIATSRQKAEDWADKQKIDVPVEAKAAIRIGRKFEEFSLAQRTYIDGDTETTFEVDNTTYKKLDIKYWDNIHIAYNTSVSRSVYYKEHGSIITHTLYLRILYEMLTDDVPLGGANCIVEKHLSNSHHPLSHFFALHGPLQHRPSESVKFKCRKPSDNLKFSDTIRDYYGENVGFYFHFLGHYTKWLYPMALLGAIWFIIQMAASSRFGIATPGSTIIVLIAIMWSTFMIENWYRREWKLRFKWGMMRYQQTEVPRPTFSGKIIVSPENAEIIETYKSWYAYCCKITFSMSTMLLCVAIVVSIVFVLFMFRGQQNDDQVLTVGIGMINSIQIFIMNKIYTWLAYKLNEWEGHRLQQDYYNNLVVKRIIFIVFNSFYSLFYIAFFDDRELYNDDRIRLEAVRTQLITLFLMAIFLQNTMEVFFPWFGKKIAQMCAKKDEEEYAENNAYVRKSQKGLLAASDDVADNAKGVIVGVDDIAMNSKGGSINQQSSYGTTPTETIADIEEQIKLVPSPDVLDNTAEIVVLHGYIMLFVIIFPLMPFLASINNYIELRVDFYNLLNGKRPIPASAAGLGVWKSVLSCFNIIAVFSNLAILTFRTPLIKDILSDFGDGQYNTDVNLIIFYFCAVLLLLLIIFVIRVVIDDVTQSTKEAIARQEACERHLLMAPVQILAKKQKIAQSKRILNLQ